MFTIYIGFDQVESVAWHTLVHSILSRSSIQVQIVPVKQSMLRGIYTRERDPRQSNEFSFTRFLVPFLNHYKGWAMFMDCDMLVTTDIKELLDLADPDKAVQVVKHEYTPCTDVKYLGAKQYQYPRKNWSSVVLWNCGHPVNKTVTPDMVNNAPAGDLHQFRWLDDDEIGDLPIEWNWLVGEYAIGEHGITHPSQVKNWHWTIGGPYFREYSHVDGADLWFKERAMMNYCRQMPEHE